MQTENGKCQIELFCNFLRSVKLRLEALVRLEALEKED
jgi:hypothetical protein